MTTFKQRTVVNLIDNQTKIQSIWSEKKTVGDEQFDYIIQQLKEEATIMSDSVIQVSDYSFAVVPKERILYIELEIKVIGRYHH